MSSQWWGRQIKIPIDYVAYERRLSDLWEAMTMDQWLRMMYLSGPIGSTNGEGKTWRRQVAETLLKEFSISTFDPAGAFTVKDSRGLDDAVSWAVYHINHAAVLQSDAVLCNLPEGKQSIGSIREIQIARTAGKPVIVVTSGHRPHFAVDLEIVESIPQAYEVIRGWAESSRGEVGIRYAGKML